MGWRASVGSHGQRGTLVYQGDAPPSRVIWCSGCDAWEDAASGRVLLTSQQAKRDPDAARRIKFEWWCQGRVHYLDIATTDDAGRRVVQLPGGKAWPLPASATGSSDGVPLPVPSLPCARSLQRGWLARLWGWLR